MTKWIILFVPQKVKLADFFLESIEGELEKVPEFFLASETSFVNKLIDSFCYAINPEYGTKKVYEVNVCSEKIEVEDISTILLMSHRYSRNINYKISGDKEGITQEKQIDYFLKSMFFEKVYHSPKVFIGNKKRELTDIVAIKKERFYLVESKAASVNDSGFEGTVSRKQARTLKHTKKAVNQLEGAIKSIRRKESIALREYVRTVFESSINAFSDRSKIIKSLFHPSFQHRLPTQLECIQAGKRQCIPHHQRSIVLVRVPLRLSPTR